jgi:hypothetical protein
MKRIKSLSVFLFLLILSTTFLFAAGSIPTTPVKQEFSVGKTDVFDANFRLILQSVLYVLGGASSGATLLIYFIRRFIKGYDLRFEQYDHVLEKREEKADKIIAMVEEIQDKWDEREEKIIKMIEDMQINLQHFRVDMTKFEYTTVSKETMVQIMTKLAVIENTCTINHKRKLP